MPYVTSVERLSREEGREEGRDEGAIQTLHEVILDLIQIYFGDIPHQIKDQVYAIDDISKLKKLYKQIPTTESLENFTDILIK